MLKFKRPFGLHVWSCLPVFVWMYCVQAFRLDGWTGLLWIVPAATVSILIYRWEGKSVRKDSAMPEDANV